MRGALGGVQVYSVSVTGDGAGLGSAEFHAAEGVGDWRVTASGAQACFAADSLRHAAGLVEQVVVLGERHGVAVDVDVRPEAVVVRVPNVDWQIPSGTPAFAAEVSVAAAALGLRAAPELVQSVNIFVAEQEGAGVRPFWLAALGYEAVDESDAVDPLRRGPSLSVNEVMDRPGRGRTHVDVSVPEDVARARVAAALAAGGRLVDDSRAPMWWTLASPDNHGVDIAAWPDARE